MSLKSVVEAQCPNGCAPFEAEAWSFIGFDRNPELRDLLLSGELNLLVCPQCHRHFYHEQTVVVHDPEGEFLAFVFPSFYKGEEGRWRTKMDADYEEMRKTFGPDRLDYRPALFFGVEELRALLEKELDLADEVEIARHLVRNLRLEPYAVRPSFARTSNIPSLLPLSPGAEDLRERLVGGLKRLLQENGYLGRYRAYLIRLLEKPEEPVPPAART